VLAVILFSPPLIWGSARADLLSLSFATIATAVDTGQQEGIFDLFALSNPDSLINNGFTSFSTTAEFDLSSVPAGAILDSTTLTSLISNIPFENCPAFCVDRSIEVLGYAGGDAIQLADFGNGEVVGSSVIGVGNINLAHDVTSFINGLRSSGTAFVGFSCGSSMVWPCAPSTMIHRSPHNMPGLSDSGLREEGDQYALPTVSTGKPGGGTVL